jgi:O-antigen ligase
MNIPIVAFSIMAMVGVWAAYDRDSAWAKYWVILGGVFLLFTLAQQTQDNLWIIISLLSCFGLILAAYFLITYDWQAQPTDLVIINRIGLWWMRVRPTFLLTPLLPNVAGGIFAMLIPPCIALGINSWDKRRVWSILVIFVIVFLSLSLLMASSRAAWFALLVSLGIWILWGISGYLANWSKRSRMMFFIASLFITGVIGLSYSITNSNLGRLLSIANTIPGAASAESRFEIYRNTLKLISDFPYTGGGLHAFPGLYSQYLLVIPFYIFDYAHNLYLDLAVEQGLFGLLGMVSIIIGSIWLILSFLQNHDYAQISLNPLVMALFASLIVMVIHGFFDDPLYGGRGTPLLFVIPGLVMAITRPYQDEYRDHALEKGNKEIKWQYYIKWLPIAVAVISTIIAFFIFRKTLISAWYANLGAVTMARVELVGWPTGQWEDETNVPKFATAERLFSQSLAYTPDNRTAHHRLGLIALLKRDFATATSHLESAYQTDNNHRGVSKNLGYSYTWAGQFDKAEKMLVNTPESQQEMIVYIGWWDTQGHPDLSSNAQIMASRLERSQ